MAEVTEAAPTEAIGAAIAADAVALAAITNAMHGTVATAADSAATRYVPITIDGVDYLLLAKLAP